MTIIKNFYSFLIDIYRSREILWLLSKNDLKAKFASSLLGVFWAFVQPLVTILVFWFVFQMGFKNPPVEGVPFMVWFVPAYLAWSFFSEVLSTSAGSMREYAYLLKKVEFRVSIIPLVKIISSSIVHVAFIGLIFIINFCYKIPFTFYNVQVVYYFACTIYLLVGLGWFLSSIAVFIKDTVNLVNVFVQIGFWLTPILWAPENMTPRIQNFLKLNPMFYICQGYRETFITNILFWTHYWQTVYFWCTSTLLFVIGALIFKRLRPHFVDML